MEKSSLTLTFYKKNRDKVWFRSLFIVLGIITIFLIWFILFSTDKTGVFPSMSKTFLTLGSLLSDSAIYRGIGFTFLRLIGGFLASFIIAYILGSLSALFMPVRMFLKPMVVLLKSIPTAALILFLIVLLKPAFSLFIIIFLLMFPIMYEAFTSGIMNVDKTVTDMLQLDFRLYNPKIVLFILTPMAKNYIFLGIIQCIGLGMKVSIMSEVMIGSSKLEGLGILLRNFYNDTNMAGVFAVSLVAILITGILDILIVLIKKKIIKN